MKLNSFVVAVLLLLCGAIAPSAAHHSEIRRINGTDGIVIPSITHGQMAVLAAYRSEILAFADSQMPATREMRRLQGYINIQYSACVWGLMPGTVTDEDSPFNECAHAYLAATRALLLELQGEVARRPAVTQLVAQIERDMLEATASLALCVHSDESFNTDDVILPVWTDVRGHLPSVLAITRVVLAICGIVLVMVRRKQV